MNIVICPLQQYGHIIPTLKLATRLKSDGFNVTFLVEPRFYEWISTLGFKHYLYPSSNIQLSVERYNEITSRFDEAYQILKPHLVLIDLFISSYSVAAIKLGIKVRTYLAVYDIAHVCQPPYHSLRTYKQQSIINAVLNFYDWIIFIFRDVFLKEIFQWKLLKRRVYLETIYRSHKLKSMSFLYPASVVDLDTIVFGPRCLSNMNLVPERYFGFCEGFPFSKNNPQTSDIKGLKINIFVSFGSMCGRYSQAKLVVQEIVNVLGADRRINLFISAAQNFADLTHLKNDRVFIFENIDQISLLRTMDVAIIHGGYGTVKDCVISKVPMLVIPFYYDQFQTARKIDNAGLGIALEYKSLNSRKIVDAVNSLVAGGYKNRFKAIYTYDQDENEFNEAYESLVGSLL